MKYSGYKALPVLIIIFLAILVLPSEEKKPENPLPEPSQPALPEKKPAHDKIAIGQWAKYQIKRYKLNPTDNKTTELSEADVKVGVVGRERVIENEYFWVEFVINEGKEEQRIVRMMFDKDGTPQAERLVLKYGKLPAVEIHLRIWEVKTRITKEMLFDEMTSELNIIPFQRILAPETFDESAVTYESIPIKLYGKESTIDCAKVLLKQSETEKPSGYIWYSDKVPLAGLVKLLVREPSYHTMILISDYGQGGVRSLIKETPVKLDFREKELQPQINTDDRR